MSQNALAQQLGRDKTTIAHWESGRHRPDDSETRQAIETITGGDVLATDWLSPDERARLRRLAALGA